MAITAVKLRAERRLNSMNLLSLLRRRRHRKVASKRNSSAEYFNSGDGLSKSENESIDRENVAAQINDSSAPYSTSDECSHVLPLHAHQSACPAVPSKAGYKDRLQGSNIIDLSQEYCMERRILALPLLISFSNILLFLTSELSRVWKRFLEIASSTTLSVKKTLVDILFVILDLAFGLFIIMLYGRELSLKPLVLAFDELKLLSTYFNVASRPSRFNSNEVCGVLGFLRTRLASGDD